MENRKARRTPDEAFSGMVLSLLSDPGPHGRTPPRYLLDPESLYLLVACSGHVLCSDIPAAREAAARGFFAAHRALSEHPRLATGLRKRIRKEAARVAREADLFAFHFLHGGGREPLTRAALSAYAAADDLHSVLSFVSCCGEGNPHGIRGLFSDLSPESAVRILDRGFLPEMRKTMGSVTHRMESWDHGSPVWSEKSGCLTTGERARHQMTARIARHFPRCPECAEAWRSDAAVVAILKRAWKDVELPPLPNPPCPKPSQILSVLSLSAPRYAILHVRKHFRSCEACRRIGRAAWRRATRRSDEEHFLETGERIERDPEWEETVLRRMGLSV